MESDSVGRERLRIFLEFSAMFEDVGKIISYWHSCCSAGSEDCAQNVECGAAVASLSKLRTREHAFLDSKRSFGDVVGTHSQIHLLRSKKIKHLP